MKTSPQRDFSAFSSEKVAFFASTLLGEMKALVCCVVKDWCVARSGGALILLQRPVPKSCFLDSCLGNKEHAVTWA